MPLFIGFVESGVPLGVTFSFLVASPMINEVAIILLGGMFGWKIALLYIVSGLVIAITSGIVIGKLGLESWVEEYVYQIRMGDAGELPEQTWPERLAYARGYVEEIVGKVWPYVVVGIGIGAIMHGYIPDDFLAQYAGAGNPLAVPLAVLVGVPLYSNAAGVVPLDRRAHPEGRVDRHLARLHDGGRRALASRGDHPAQGAQAQAHRRLLRRQRRRHHGHRLPVQHRFSSRGGRLPPSDFPARRPHDD